jgi:hypothetical protein
MELRNLTAIGTLTLALVVPACNRAEQPTPDATRDAVAEGAAEAQKERADAMARLNERVAAIEREYAEKNAEVASGAKTATAALREEVREDVDNVKEAVASLGTTTADNWWDRHEQALRRTADDVEADVKHLAKQFRPVQPAAAVPAGAPFTSRRDAFVADLRARVDGFAKALDDVKASGPRETELDDTRARVHKLREDVDRLASAKADDWWDVTRARVTDYVDRVEASIKRLDDNKARS